MKITLILSTFTLLAGLTTALPAAAADGTLDEVITISSDLNTIIGKRTVLGSSLDQVLTVSGSPVASGDSNATNTTIDARGICLTCDKNDNGGGGGTSTGSAPPAHNPNAAWLNWKQDWHFDGGVPVSGSHSVTLWSDGYVNFKTHFHNSGAPDYNYYLSCALRDQAGHVYSLLRSGSVKGLRIFGGGSRDSDKDEMRYNVAVRDNWNSIRTAPTMHCKASVRWDAIALLNELINLVKQIGPIVGAVISLF